MNFTQTLIIEKQKLRIENLLPKIGVAQAQKEIIASLTAGGKRLSSKFFYDDRGSELFEQITHLREYYPTRTEMELLKTLAPELMNRHKTLEIVELGSGDCSKISVLLEAIDRPTLERVKYVPVDFSQSAIEKSADELSAKFPNMEIHGFVADFSNQLAQIPHSGKPRLVFFLGSTIGNFETFDAKKIMQNMAAGLLPGDSLLVGFDLVKAESFLNAAYNDAAQVTEQFNKNILQVVNGIIQSDFNSDDFDHYAFFNPRKNRVEMHLVANKALLVRSALLPKPLKFEKGESIHTENSHKFSNAMIDQLANFAGLKIKNSFTDRKNWFALVEFTK